MVCVETGVLVGMEPQLWGSRGPFHQDLRAPTPHHGALSLLSLYMSLPEVM